MNIKDALGKTFLNCFIVAAFFEKDHSCGVLEVAKFSRLKLVKRKGMVDYVAAEGAKLLYCCQEPGAVTAEFINSNPYDRSGSAYYIPVGFEGLNMHQTATGGRFLVSKKLYSGSLPNVHDWANHEVQIATNKAELVAVIINRALELIGVPEANQEGFAIEIIKMFPPL